MVIGKLDLREWRWGKEKLRPPHRIILSLVAYPIYIIGRLIVAFAVLISDLSLSSAIKTYHDIM